MHVHAIHGEVPICGGGEEYEHFLLTIFKKQNICPHSLGFVLNKRYCMKARLWEAHFLLSSLSNLV
jgi:hypothetical protein